MHLQKKMTVALLALVSLSGILSAPSCEYGFYLSSRTGDCTPCTQCKDNEFTTRLCYGDKDTVCSSWPKFHFLYESAVAAAEDVKGTQTGTEIPTTSAEIVTSQDHRWFTITMILVGILVLICVAGVVIVLVTCVICKRKEHREIVYKAGFVSSITMMHDSPDGRAAFKTIPQTET